MKYQVLLGGRTWEIDIAGTGLTVDGVPYAAELRTIEGTPLRLLFLERAARLLAMESRGRGIWLVQDTGELLEVVVLDERAAHIRSLVGVGSDAVGPAVLKAPMPGLVVRVMVAEGQTVSPGQGLVVLEAMKMENELKAAASGVMDRILVAPGQPVEKGAVLATFRSPHPLP
jgi:pyruvate carboxylase subunit B